jgi:FeS assembly SUF system protein
MIIDDKAGLQDAIIGILKTVHDPEIPVDIYELGLVYELKTDEQKNIQLTITLTAPGCPVAGDIIAELDQKLHDIEGVNDVNVMLTFDPPWNKDMMSEEARLELGFM